MKRRLNVSKGERKVKKRKEKRKTVRRKKMGLKKKKARNNLILNFIISNQKNEIKQR